MRASKSATVTYLPCPRPLPLAYTHETYEPPDHLRAVGQRVLQLFIYAFVGGMGVVLVFFVDWDSDLNEGVHAAIPLQYWLYNRLRSMGLYRFAWWTPPGRKRKRAIEQAREKAIQEGKLVVE